MASHFKTAFDLTGDPSSVQPAYCFYALFFIVGIGLASWAFVALRRGWRGRKRVAAFATVWLGLTSYVSLIDAEDTLWVRHKVTNRDVTTVEGCPAYFHPGERYGSKTEAGNERWSIADHDFNYGAGEVRPGYHITEPNGGAVHSDTRIRASFVISPHFGRAEIVRLMVAEHACPPAPDHPSL